MSIFFIHGAGPSRSGERNRGIFLCTGHQYRALPGCVLGNEFGMIILTSGNSENIEGLIKDLDNLRQNTGLDIYIRKTKAPRHREVLPSIPYKLIAMSIDHPGIIHQICKALHERGINIEDISTNVDNNIVTGANVFQMICNFSLPPAVKIFDLKDALNRISDEYNIDIRFDAVINK